MIVSATAGSEPIINIDATTVAFIFGLRSASGFGDSRLVERRPDTLGKLYGVIVGPEMHEEHARLLDQHMTVERCHFDTIRP